MQFDIEKGGTDLIKPSFLPAVAVEFTPKDGEPGKEPLQFFRPYGALSPDELEKGAKHNDPGALQELGERYYFGIGGKPQSDKLAYEYFLKAAEHNVQDAEYLIAECYRQGRAVKQDCKKYFEWLDRAAQHGSWMAMFGLSAAYRTGSAPYGGEGPEVNAEQSFSWSIETEQAVMAYWKFYTMPRFIDFDEILRILMQAYLRICVQLSEHFTEGFGTEQSFDRAVFWLERAKRFGIEATGNRDFNAVDPLIKRVKQRAAQESGQNN